MASVSENLVKYLREVFKPIESNATETYISVIEKAGKMNNPEIDKILERIYAHVQKNEWAEFGAAFTLLYPYPELQEGVLTANMAALEMKDFSMEAPANTSDKDKFIAKRICELALTDETAFDNDKQREQHAKFMKMEGYRIDFLNSMRESLTCQSIPAEDKKLVSNILSIAEKEYSELSAR